MEKVCLLFETLKPVNWIDFWRLVLLYKLVKVDQPATMANCRLLAETTTISTRVQTSTFSTFLTIYHLKVLKSIYGCCSNQGSDSDKEAEAHRNNGSCALSNYADVRSIDRLTI